MDLLSKEWGHFLACFELLQEEKTPSHLKLESRDPCFTLCCLAFLREKLFLCWFWGVLASFICQSTCQEKKFPLVTGSISWSVVEFLNEQGPALSILSTCPPPVTTGTCHRQDLSLSSTL